MSGRGQTTYLVASKADDASQIALGISSRRYDDDGEPIDDSAPNSAISSPVQPQRRSSELFPGPGAVGVDSRVKRAVARDVAREEDNTSQDHTSIESTKMAPSTVSRSLTNHHIMHNPQLSTSKPPQSASSASASTSSPHHHSQPSHGQLQHHQSQHHSPQQQPQQAQSPPQQPRGSHSSRSQKGSHGLAPPQHVVVSNSGPGVIITSGHFSMQGIRPEMEDRVTLLPHPEFNRTGNLVDNLNRSFFAVFDGHGGDVSAEYCRQHVHNNLYLSDAFLQGRPAEGLKAALAKTEAEFCAACRRINLMTSSGTTAITAYLEADMLYVANIGDSRAVLCRSGRAIDASTDHKPGRRDEKARIESLGGRVGITEEDAFRATPRPCPCLWSCISAGRPLRVFPGGLSVSRTIGDISMKTTQLVSSESELFETRLTSADEFLILACDGVWDVMNSQQAVDCVRGNLFRSNNDAEEASKHLANEAFRKGSTDNISVVVITLEMPKQHAAAGEAASSSHGRR